MPIKIYGKTAIAARIILAALLLFIGWMIYRFASDALAAIEAGDKVAAIMHFLVMVFWFAVLGVVFAKFILPGLIDRGVAGLLMPERRITEPVDLLSPIEGLVRQERYEEALDGIAGILAERPRSMGANFLLARLYFDELARPDLGMEVVEHYFAPAAGVPARSENVPVILRYCEIAENHGRRDLALKLLDGELTRKYAPPERRLLEQRREALTG